MRAVFFFLISFFLLIPAANALAFSEIMYNIAGSDTGREWIEIVNDGGSQLNLTGWKLYEAGTNHGLTLVQGSMVLDLGQYAVIVSDPDKFLSDNPHFSGNLIDSSFSLSNTNETLAIKNSSLEVVAEVTYLSSWGADENNKSLQFCGSEWGEGTPTPGSMNFCSDEGDDEEEQDQTPPPSETPPSDDAESCIGEPSIEISSHPDSMAFGDNGKISVKVNTSCYDDASIMLLAYGSSSRVVSNSSGSKITSYASCQNGALFDVSEGKEYSREMTFFIYPNCDGYYPDGDYNVSVRACSPSGEKLDEETFKASLSGSNSSVCGIIDQQSENSSASAGNDTESASSEDVEEEPSSGAGEEEESASILSASAISSNELESMEDLTNASKKKDAPSPAIEYGVKNSFSRNVAAYLVAILSALIIVYLVREGKI